jgi:hypothetical protein
MQLGQTITAKLEVSEQTFKGVGGLAIFTRSWRPVTQPRGVVVIAPGFNSHSGQYGRVPAAAFGQLRQLLPSPEGQCARRTSETARTSRPFSTPAPHLSRRCDAQGGVAR